MRLFPAPEGLESYFGLDSAFDIRPIIPKYLKMALTGECSKNNASHHETLPSLDS